MGTTVHPSPPPVTDEELNAPLMDHSFGGVGAWQQKITRCQRCSMKVLSNASRANRPLYISVLRILQKL